MTSRRRSPRDLPGNDFWVFDDRLVRFAHFAGTGEFRYDDLTDDPAVVRLCIAAFDAVWTRGIPHAEYQPTGAACPQPRQLPSSSDRRWASGCAKSVSTLGSPRPTSAG